MKQRLFSLLLALCLLLTLVLPIHAAAPSDAEAAFQDTAAYLYSLVQAPTITGFGGDWTVLALTRSGFPVSRGWLDGYLTRAAAYVKELQGVLHQRKYTEYSRVVLTMTAVGQDPRDVGGYDLLSPLLDFDAVTRQGITGCAYALLALDSGAYETPEGLRQQYVDELLSRELEGGGFALSGVVADPDVTAMVLQALAPYGDQQAVTEAAERAFARLSALQQEDGGFMSYGVACSESAAQVILALDAWNLPFDDNRFVKNGCTVTDALLTYWRPGAGFVHTADSNDGSVAIVSCEQGLLALSAIHRRSQGRGSLYTMTDVSARFPDISGHPGQTAIETLAEAGIFNGVGDGTFRPDAPLDRASFCTMTVKLLEAEPQWEALFDDVAEGSWYGGYICAAGALGITQGTGPRQFTPSRSVTRAEGAVMLYRAARTLGVVSEPEDGQRGWQECLLWCRENGLWLWDNDADGTVPLERGEAAQLLLVLFQQKAGE